MKTATDMVWSLENHLGELLLHATTLEKNNALMKRVIWILSKGFCLDENGSTTLKLSSDEVEFIKKVCNDADVFNTGKLEGI